MRGVSKRHLREAEDSRFKYYLIPVFEGLTAVMLVLTLSACSIFDLEKDTPLLGTRVDVLGISTGLAIDDNINVPNIPIAWINNDWPQRGGQPTHVMDHLALKQGPLKRVWAVDIGASGSKASPLVTQPVVSNGRVYVMDSDHQLSSIDLQDGDKKWQVFVGPKSVDDEGVGGGVAVDEDRLYITNGNGEILSLTADQGAEVWRTVLPAPARSAPTVLDGRAYIILIDGQVVAVDQETGKMLWSYRGVADGSRLRGAPSPAANADLVVAPFSSGDLTALRPENGSVAWTDHLSPSLRLGGLSTLADIRALPIVTSGIVLALSYADRMVAIDMNTGTRLWQKEVGGADTPWVAGDTVYVLTKTAQLSAMDVKTGSVHWVHSLPRFSDLDDPSSTPIFWTSPLMAGGQVRVFGTDGRVVDIDPKTGRVMIEWSIDNKPAVPVTIADETMLILDDNATLSAWR